MTRTWSLYGHGVAAAAISRADSLQNSLQASISPQRPAQRSISGGFFARQSLAILAPDMADSTAGIAEIGPVVTRSKRRPSGSDPHAGSCGQTRAAIGR